MSVLSLAPHSRLADFPRNLRAQMQRGPETAKLQSQKFKGKRGCGVGSSDQEPYPARIVTDARRLDSISSQVFGARSVKNNFDGVISATATGLFSAFLGHV